MLAGRLTRSYVNSDTVAFKLLKIAFKLLSCWVVKLPLKTSGCYSTNLRLLVFWITNTSHVSWKYWAMMDYGKIKKWPDEIRCLDWLTLIDRYLLVINDWLADIDWPDHLTCSSYSVRMETPWEDLVNKDSKFTHSTTSAALYRWQ